MDPKATVMEPTALMETARMAPTPTEPTAVASSPFPHLGQLVGDAAVEDFRRIYLGRDAFRHQLGGGRASRLFSWELLNRAVAEHRLGPPRLKLEKAGADISRAAFREHRPRPGQVIHDLDVVGLYAELRDGATLILDAVNELHAPLQQLCAGLADEFRAYCQANLYACWGASQGFDVHWDDHDVFVVQVAGEKRWDLYGPTRPAPLRRDPTPAPKPTCPPREMVLTAGDMLYLPRGHWHAAVGLGQPSLHLTIGLSRKTGNDLLRWLADEALADVDIRADLPLEADDDALGGQVAKLLQSLLASGDPADLGRRYRRHVEATTRRRPQLSLPDIGRAEDGFGPTDRIRLSAGATGLEAGPDPSSVRFAHRGTYYLLAAEIAPMLAGLMAGDGLSYADLVERCRPVSEPRLRAFVRDMLRNGVLVIEGDR